MFNEQYIRASEAAKFLGVDTRTAVAWLTAFGAQLMSVRAGQITTVLVWKPDLDRFVNEHSVKPEPKSEPKRRGRPPKLQLAKQG